MQSRRVAVAEDRGRGLDGVVADHAGHVQLTAAGAEEHVGREGSGVGAVKIPEHPGESVPRIDKDRAHRAAGQFRDQRTGRRRGSRIRHRGGEHGLRHIDTRS